MKAFLCPSDTPFKSLPHGFGYTSYAGSAGWDAHRRLHGDERIAGVFPLMDSVAIGDIRDGTSNVIMVGEVTNRAFCCGSQWRGNSGRPRVGTGEPVFRSLLIAPAAWIHDHVWIQQGGGPLLRANDGSAGPVWGSFSSPHALPPVYYCHYSMGVEWPGAGSQHPSGGNFALADGSVKFVKDTIKTGDGVTGPVGDPYGRYGNIWSGAHEIQKIPDAAQVRLDN